MARHSNKNQIATETPRAFRLVGGRVTKLSPAVAAPQPQIRPAPSEEQVRELAYRKWEFAGRPPGDGVAFWLDAERELNDR